MKPYRTFLGDCFQGMQSLASESIDLVVTSPPYDNLRTYNGTLDWSFEKFTEIAAELARVLKPGGVIVWVVGDKTHKGSETGSSLSQALYFKNLGLNLHDTMIYQKLNTIPLNHNRYEQDFEYMFVLTKGKPKSFNPIRVECKYAGTGHKPTYYQTSSDTLSEANVKGLVKDTKIKGNIWGYLVGNHGEDSKYKHPAKFPLQLAIDHILSWSNEGDTVLDPFMGSGTTGVAAIQNDRRFIGTEIVPEYYEISRQRLKEAFDAMEAVSCSG